MIDIALIGTGGMVPLPERFLTCLAVRCNGRELLIDCGEGTQITLKKLGWGLKKLDYICFTHFHADHIAGLPGLLLTIGNAGRTEPLTFIGPNGIEHIVTCLRVIAPELPFNVKYIQLPLDKESVLQLGEYRLSSLPLDHRISCLGYSIYVSRPGKFDVQRAKYQNIPLKFWKALQKGETIINGEKTYTPDMVTGPERAGIKVSYITDTRPIEVIPGFISDSDLFICEGLYGDDEKLPNAEKYKHMLFSEAAKLAKDGNVKELWLTHYSPAMTDPEKHIDSAKDIFTNVIAGYDRMTKTLLFQDD